MSERRLLGDMEACKKLAENLGRVGQVTRYDQGEEKEAWTLVHALSDLEQSFQKILEDQLPRLLDSDLEPRAVNGVLLDIGEELRHILYHIRDPRYYSYLHGSTDREHGGER